MELTIENTPSYKIGLEGLDEIVQNVKVILNTPKGTVPLDRDFGVDWSIVDTPTTKTFQKLRVNIVKTVEKYEPRVKVKAVEIIPDEMIMDGVFKVKLRVEINIS